MKNLNFRQFWMWQDRYLLVVWTYEDGSLYGTTMHLYNNMETEGILYSHIGTP